MKRKKTVLNRQGKFQAATQQAKAQRICVEPAQPSICSTRIGSGCGPFPNPTLVLGRTPKRIGLWFLIKMKSRSFASYVGSFFMTKICQAPLEATQDRSLAAVDNMCYYVSIYTIVLHC